MRNEFKNSELTHTFNLEKHHLYRRLCLFLLAAYLFLLPQVAVAQDTNQGVEPGAAQIQNNDNLLQFLPLILGEQNLVEAAALQDDPVAFQAFLDSLVYKQYLPMVQTDCTPNSLTPSDIIFLMIWKLFLPIDYDKNGEADVILWQGGKGGLCTFVQSGIFEAGTNGLGENYVELKVRKGDTVTTPESSNPRTEFRQMEKNGVDDAAWDARVGTHRLVLQFAVKELGLDAEGKEIPVVVAQVHGPSSDVLQIRLRKVNGLFELVAHYDDADGVKQNFVLVSDYKLGEKVEVDLLAKEEEINGVKVGVIKVTAFARGVEIKHDIILVFPDGLFFQAGNYTQGQIADGLSEVQIFALNIFQ